MISKVEDTWYRCVTSSVWRRCIISTVEGCIMDLSHYQYRGQCAVHGYQNCSRGSWWLYLATITRCDLSATILFKFVDSYLIAFKFAQ